MAKELREEGLRELIRLIQKNQSKSSGSYKTSSLLSKEIEKETKLELTDIEGIAEEDIVFGETLVYDSEGTVAVLKEKNGTGYTAITMTTTSDIEISKEEGNIVEMKTDGLYAIVNGGEI